ncbi:hypothetical protein ACERK3_01395 [Phycisphaerales bacterium AB-hyl4]|uniref:Uncharacterized protein n=1 Tax=Natronomicrosphaera hydrolytica TaxID=3242702 RepID=A0ABV4U270_9BACT
MLNIPQIQDQLVVMRLVAGRDAQSIAEKWSQAMEFGEALAAAIDAGAFSGPAYAPIRDKIERPMQLRAYEVALSRLARWLDPSGRFHGKFAPIIHTIEEQIAGQCDDENWAKTAAETASSQASESQTLEAPTRPSVAHARVNWETAQAEAERIVRDRGGHWPGLNALAREIGCAKGTILKAIRHSTYLQACAP